ncbi:hypothetical protein DLM45_03180 [Hyphomicrobium methylovorum]|nr:hypothetical protein [Hyphomicrobium methylovorum]
MRSIVERASAHDVLCAKGTQSQTLKLQRGVKSMKAIVLGICFVSLALGACRRESPEPDYAPMKLGATTAAPATAER